jgi:glycosyltransferase involved in cell wall biosynthesis
MFEIKLSIIIATYNRHEQLKICLDSIYYIFSSLDFASNFEIRVIDQSEEIFEDALFFNKNHKNFHYKRIPIKNASFARNVGANESSGKYLWFMDDDAELKSFDISPLFKELDIFFISWKEKQKVFDVVYPYNKLNLLRRSGTPFYILNKLIFESVLGFNENLGPGTIMRGGEDLDLLLRVNRSHEIRCFKYHGVLAHPLVIADSNKKHHYYFARGYVLAVNHEYCLFIVNLVYDLWASIGDGVGRPVGLIRGFFMGIK